MRDIVFKVAPSLNRWALIHGDIALATFDTRREAEATAIGLARARPKACGAGLDTLTEKGEPSLIKIF